MHVILNSMSMDMEGQSQAFTCQAHASITELPDLDKACDSKYKPSDLEDESQAFTC